MNPLLRDELAAIISEEMSRPAASISKKAIKRDADLLRLNDLVVMYNLGWLVRQETQAVHGIVDCLSDDGLECLLSKVDRAVEAIHDGVPFVEVGLVRGASCFWVA